MIDYVLSWRRQWHPTPVLLPGKSHGRRSLVGCSPWGHEESYTTAQLHFHFSLSCIGEGNGNPLQCSCLENPRDGGAWWAAVYRVAQSRTRLKRLSSSSMFSLDNFLDLGYSKITSYCLSPFILVLKPGYKHYKLLHSIYNKPFLKCVPFGTFLVIEWLRFCASNAGCASLIPGQGNKDPTCHMAKNKRNFLQLNKNENATYQLKIF